MANKADSSLKVWKMDAFNKCLTMHVNLAGLPIFQLLASFGFRYRCIHPCHFRIVLGPKRIIVRPPEECTKIQSKIAMIVKKLKSKLKPNMVTKLLFHFSVLY